MELNLPGFLQAQEYNARIEEYHRQEAFFNLVSPFISMAPLFGVAMMSKVALESVKEIVDSL